MIKKLFLIFFVFSANIYADDVLDFISLKEGLPVAYEKIAEVTNDYTLIGCITAKGSTVELNMGGPQLIDVIYEGENIGKSNLWAYFFMDNTSSSLIEVNVLKVIPMGGTMVAEIQKSNQGLKGLLADWIPLIHTDMPLDTANLLDSDAWTKQLANNSSFLPVTIGAYCGVWAPNSDWQSGGKLNNFNWYSCAMTEHGEQWCFSSFDNTDISCADVGIEEKLPAINVEISPNPAQNELLVFADLDDIKLISIYDVSGDLIVQYPKHMKNIDISALRTGSYYISFLVGDTVVFRQFIKN